MDDALTGILARLDALEADIGLEWDDAKLEMVDPTAGEVAS